MLKLCHFETQWENFQLCLPAFLALVKVFSSFLEMTWFYCLQIIAFRLPVALAYWLPYILITLSLFPVALCSSGFGICLTINTRAPANTFSALKEKCTNGFITVQVSCKVSILLTGFSAVWLPIRFEFWFVMVVLCRCSYVILNRATFKIHWSLRHWLLVVRVWINR